ncbi:hypothetical protein [Acinetobacter pittii]|nr:hypothetical protein [Acinetobacter pittii]MCE6238517.1 hypothetical protein [Acinetobacter pittii]MCE6693269.1 hypothetical protein [Acinetobacter pittii]MCE6700723.1 hypothetical protein [Acinetobacter pittii]
MDVRQNVQGNILKLSQELSAGNGILEKSGKNDFLITFQPVLLARSIKID